MTIYTTDCVCSSEDPHFCPPCMGDPGFYACRPKDVIVEVRRLRAEVKRLSGERCVWCCELVPDCRLHSTCARGMGR